MEELNKIEEKIDQIISLITNSNSYKRYEVLKEEINNHDKINELVNKIKDLQKIAVKKEYNKEDINSIDKEIESLYKELNNIPLYIEYNNYLEKLDEEQLLIKDKINNYFDNIV